jgi:quinoprotein glucose dehydrogenase
MFLPPVVSKVGGPIQSITIGTLGGGTNWPGASYDPETHTVFAQAANAGVSLLGLVEPPPGFSDIRYVAGVAGQPFRVNEGPGFGSGADAPELSETQKKLNAILARQGQPPAPARPAAPPPAASAGATPTPAPAPGGLNVQGLTVVKPPYGVVSAINLDRGDLVWQVPHGDTPDQVRNHPALRGLNIPKTGQQGSVGLMVTKTLVILGDPAVTTTPEHPRGAMLRAYDKTNGNQVGAVWMPAPQSGSPMTYSVDGRQYIIVAVSGGSYTGEYIAFSLPQSEVRTQQ